MNIKKKINYLKFSDEEHRSFSQFGEDKFMWGFLKHLKTGYYVDIGSSHPINGNNTYLFYLNGWNGICIDPLLNENLYSTYRPKDEIIKKFYSINGEESFYYCNELEQISGNKIFSIFKDFNFEKKVIDYINKDVFNLIVKKHINLLSIDCEGLDLEILKTLIFLLPDVICIEINEEKLNELDNILIPYNYKKHYYNHYNTIYIKNSYLKLINPFN
jgi:hypothetical protein